MAAVPAKQRHERGSVLSFVPVDRLAIDLIPRSEWGAVLDLYQRAHQLRYRPFSVSLRPLARSWGVGTTRARAILSILEAEGLLSVEPSKAGTRVCVFSPTRSAERNDNTHTVPNGTTVREHRGEHLREHLGEQQREHRENGDAVVSNAGFVDHWSALANTCANTCANTDENTAANTLDQTETETETEEGVSLTAHGLGLVVHPGREVDGWKLEEVARVYEAYRARHPRKPPNPTTSEIKRITSAIEQLARAYRPRDRPRYVERDIRDAGERIRMVIDWIHDAPDAAFYQGDNKNGPGGRGVKYLGLITPILDLPKLSDKIEKAAKWKEDGAEFNETKGLAEFAGEAERAWRLLDGFIRDGRIPDRVSDHNERDQAFKAAIAEVGFDRVGMCSSPAEERSLRAEWIECYSRSRRSLLSAGRHDTKET